MRPTNDNDAANVDMECDEDDLRTDLAIAEEALARYEAKGIAGTRPYSEYLASRLESAE